jgi:hypothetical protein
VYKQKVATGGWNGMYSSEPSQNINNHQVYWEATEIRYHYPAEHTIKDASGVETQYDLEV